MKVLGCGASLKSALTSRPLTATASFSAARVAGTVTWTSTSPPLIRSARVEIVSDLEAVLGRLGVRRLPARTSDSTMAAHVRFS